MSRYGLGLLGDFEDDPFFGSHMRHMNNMMNSMFADPFGMMGPPALTHQDPQQRMIGMGGMGGMGGMMMPFGFPNMGNLFSNLQNMGSNPNCHSFSSSSVMTMTTGPDGRPQVYQESMSTHSAPGGIKETKKTVSDSRTGTRKMAIGHHIGDRAHILEREHNTYSGEQEEHQEFINLDEEEADAFNHEWESKTRRSVGAIGGPSHRSHNPYSRSYQGNQPQLALPSTSPSSHQSKNQSRPRAKARRPIKRALSPKTNDTSSSLRSNERSSASATTTSSPENKSRKREHSPEIEIIEETSSSNSNNGHSNKRRSGQERQQQESTTSRSSPTTITLEKED